MAIDRSFVCTRLSRRRDCTVAALYRHGICQMGGYYNDRRIGWDGQRYPGGRAIALREGEKVSISQMIICLRQTLTYTSPRHIKGDPRRCRLRVLNDPDWNTLDIALLLLCQAMRRGHTTASTIEEAIAAAVARRDRRIMFCNAKQPVLPSRWDPDKPMLQASVRRAVADAAEHAGVLAPVVTPHSIRHGAAQDLTDIKGLQGAGAKPAVARAMGHSSVAYSKGLTDSYAGRPIDTWTQKHESVKARGNKTDFFGVPVSSTPYHKKSWTHAEVDDYMATYKSASQQAACAAMREADKRKWVEEQLSSIDDRNRLTTEDAQARVPTTLAQGIPTEPSSIKRRPCQTIDDTPSDRAVLGERSVNARVTSNIGQYLAYHTIFARGPPY